MKIKIKHLRQLIKEAVQDIPAYEDLVTFEMIAKLQDELDDQLMRGMISTHDYNEEWKDILSSLGWTESRYETAIDRNWDKIASKIHRKEEDELLPMDTELPSLFKKHRDLN